MTSGEGDTVIQEIAKLALVIPTTGGADLDQRLGTANLVMLGAVAIVVGAMLIAFVIISNAHKQRSRR